MHIDDAAHGLAVRKTDVVEEAAAQEGVGQLLLVVAGDDDDGAMPGADQGLGLIDIELHPVQLAQQVVGKFDIRLVDFIDQEHRALRALERLPHRAFLDVVGDVMYPRVAQLGIAQPRDGIVFIQPLLGLAGGFHVPLEQRPAERAGHFLGQQGLAGAGFTLDQQGTLQRDRRIHGQSQFAWSDVRISAFKTHGHILQ